MKKITIVIVDDHKLIRQIWADAFAGKTGFEVTGTCGTVDEAVEMIKNKRPDIVLLDIKLAEHSGFDAIPLIRKYSPGSRIIGVSMHNQPAYAKKMMHLGAKGYVTKNSPFEELLIAIEEVMKGEVYICVEIKDILAAQMNKDTGETDIKNLTLREMEIIKLMKDGFSTKEISTQLHIGTRTVEVHRYNILKRLKLKNSLSLVNLINTSIL